MKAELLSEYRTLTGLLEQLQFIVNVVSAIYILNILLERNLKFMSYVFFHLPFCLVLRQWASCDSGKC